MGRGRRGRVHGAGSAPRAQSPIKPLLPPSYACACGGGAAPARSCRACAAAAPGTGMSGPGGPGPAGAKLDINRAGVAELEGALSGIGRRRARGIVRKREVRGAGGSGGDGVPDPGLRVAASVAGWGPWGECRDDSAVSVLVAGAGGAGRDPRGRQAGRAQPPPVLPSLLPGPGSAPGRRGEPGSGGMGRAPRPDCLRTPSPAMLGRDPAAAVTWPGAVGAAPRALARRIRAGQRQPVPDAAGMGSAAAGRGRAGSVWHVWGWKRSWRSG